MTAPAADPIDWSAGVVARYETALWEGRTLTVRDPSGRLLAFDVHRWLDGPDAADSELLDRCCGPTLDVGCGPGRLVAALSARGVPTLGVDVATAAVAIARAPGAMVLRRSVFDRLPGAGRWSAALLADGNIGIGGDPAALLARLRELLAPGGLALVEVDTADVQQRFVARIVAADGRVLDSFPWVRIGASALVDVALGLGYVLTERWDSADRRFVALRRR